MDELIQSIYDSPEEWKQAKHHFYHSSGVSIWSSNGFLFFNMETGGSFSFMQKIRAYKAYRWWISNAPIKSLKA